MLPVLQNAFYTKGRKEFEYDYLLKAYGSYLTKETIGGLSKITKAFTKYHDLFTNLNFSILENARSGATVYDFSGNNHNFSVVAGDGWSGNEIPDSGSGSWQNGGIRCQNASIEEPFPHLEVKGKLECAYDSDLVVGAGEDFTVMGFYTSFQLPSEVGNKQILIKRGNNYSVGIMETGILEFKIQTQPTLNNFLYSTKVCNDLLPHFFVARWDYSTQTMHLRVDDVEDSFVAASNTISTDTSGIEMFNNSSGTRTAKVFAHSFFVEKSFLSNDTIDTLLTQREPFGYDIHQLTYDDANGTETGVEYGLWKVLSKFVYRDYLLRVTFQNNANIPYTEEVL